MIYLILFFGLLLFLARDISDVFYLIAGLLMLMVIAGVIFIACIVANVMFDGTAIGFVGGIVMLLVLGYIWRPKVETVDPALTAPPPSYSAPFDPNLLDKDCFWVCRCGVVNRTVRTECRECYESRV